MQKYLFLLGILLFQTSCEDVINVDLNDVPPKLVIEASINWFKGTLGREQTIKLSLTAPFFNDSISPANGAAVKITDQNNVEYVFWEEADSGIYRNNSFVPKIGESYTLQIDYNGEIYVGEEILQSVVPIDYVEQNRMGGFTGEDTELKVFYTDPADQRNFYCFEFLTPVSNVPDLSVYEDRYNNGNQIFGFFSEEDLLKGDNVNIRNYGISERFYNYMFILLQQSSDASGGPFETQPASVKGNCINTTNPVNFPLGYFRLSEVAELSYTIQ